MIVFGKYLHWEEIQWHIGECKRLGVINREFAVIRKFGSVTLRVNSKNSKKLAPEVIYTKCGKKDKAINNFLDFYEMCKDI